MYVSLFQGEEYDAGAASEANVSEAQESGEGTDADTSPQYEHNDKPATSVRTFVFFMVHVHIRKYFLKT